MFHNSGFDAKSGNVLFNYNMYDVTNKAWGEERLLAKSAYYTSKLMVVYPGYKCSLHKHNNKHETFTCLCGSGHIELDREGVGKTSITIGPGVKITVQTGAWHRFWSRKGMILLETSTYDDPQDCERKEPSMRMANDDEQDVV